MKPIIVKSILVLIFIASAYFSFEFASGISTTSNGFIRYGYNGGAIGFGLISSAALLGFIYYDCNRKK